MNPRVTKVTPEENYCLLLEFSNGERREFDVSPYLDKGIFTQLKEKSYFQQARASMGTVEWPKGQDFCPDTLFEESRVIA
jgi:hypothetical protein